MPTAVPHCIQNHKRRADPIGTTPVQQAITLSFSRDNELATLYRDLTTFQPQGEFLRFSFRVYG